MKAFVKPATGQVDPHTLPAGDRAPEVVGSLTEGMRDTHASLLDLRFGASPLWALWCGGGDHQRVKRGVAKPTAGVPAGDDAGTRAHYEVLSGSKRA